VPWLSVFRWLDDPDELAQLACEVGACTLVLDELDRAAHNKEWRSPWVRRIVHEGRHYRVNLWGTFRRTQNVPEDIITQADRIYVFRHSAAALYDLRALERLGPEYPSIATQLAVGQFVVWGDDDGS
jgi:DNA helicase HerA-like ATPase